MRLKKEYILNLVIALAVTFAITAKVFSASWYAPTGLPPDKNAEAPIRASSTVLQTIYGSLVVNGLFSLADTWDAYFSGKVGIGTTSPSQALDIAGGINFTGTMNVNGSQGTAGQVLTSNGAGTAPQWSTLSSGALPYASIIFATTTAAPAGYTYTGNYVIASTTSWSAKAPMPTPRSYLATAVVNNIIYAIGGYGSPVKVYDGGAGTMVDTNCLNANEAYDPSTNTWTSKTPMPTNRYGLAAAPVGNIIYAVGGLNYNGSGAYFNEAYDTSANTWATKASMPTGRYSLTAVAINSLVYAIGGSNGSALSANEAYNPISNTWSARTAMPTARISPAAVVINNPAMTMINGIIYIIGGFNAGAYLSTNEAYNCTTNTWASKASMPTGRTGLAATVINDNATIYVLGGNNGTSVLSVNEIYDVVANSWSGEIPMPTARTGLAASTVNNVVYAIGGDVGYGNPSWVGTNESLATTTTAYYLFQKN